MRPERAVGAQRRDTQLSKCGGDFLRTVAAQRPTIFDERHLRHDRYWAQAVCDADRFDQLGQAAKCLEQEHVDATVEQGLDLLAKGVAKFAHRQAVAKSGGRGRADGARHQQRRVPSLALRFARQAHPGPIQLGSSGFQAEARQPGPAGPKGVGLDDVGAGGDVCAMDRADQVAVRNIQLGQRAVERHAARVQHRAHGAVAHQHLSRQSLADVQTARRHVDSAADCPHDGG